MQATFAAGCFWGIQETFDKVKGVLHTEVGYTGGYIPNPTYEEVCTHATGHAEAVLVEFDPDIIPYESLLQVFWNCHDPTTLNRQGLDVGNQYRSAIFYHNEDQKLAALDSKTALEASKKYPNKIVTQIASAKPFYRAEENHQHYYEKHPK